MKKWLIGALIVVAFILFAGSCDNSKNNNSPNNPFTEPGVADAIMTKLKNHGVLKGHNLKVSFVKIDFKDGNPNPWIQCYLKRGTEDKIFIFTYQGGKWFGDEDTSLTKNSPYKIFFDLNSIDFKKLPDMTKALEKKYNNVEPIKNYSVGYYVSPYGYGQIASMELSTTSDKLRSTHFDFHGNLKKY